MDADTARTESNISVHPGIYIKKNILEKTGLTQKELGAKLGVSRQTINQLISGAINLSPTMALRLSNEIGESVDFWLNLQGKYDGTKSVNHEVLDDKSPDEVVELWRALGARTLVDHEIQTGVEAGIIGIENFSFESVQPASYDLRVGKKAIESSGHSKHEINVEETDVILGPKEIAIFQSLERLSFPIFILGRLGAMTDLSSNGIVMLHGLHVDPGFEGHIYVTLYNIGNSKFTLKYEQTFITLELNYLSILPSRQYLGKNTKRTQFLNSELETVKARRK